MNRLRYAIGMLLVAGLTLAGCDVSSPAAATPAPTTNAQPGSTAVPGYPPAPTTGAAPDAYPSPLPTTPTPYPPGYVPPSPQP